MNPTTLDPAAVPMDSTSPVDTVSAALGRCDGIDLAQLNRCARLQTRKDRKYVVSAGRLAEVLHGLPDHVMVLDTDNRRWFRYESVYFDTGALDSYRLAATRRPCRFKVRTRTYVDSGLRFAEVKTKDRRGRTVKHRLELDGDAADATDAVRTFAGEFGPIAAYADRLEPAATNSYLRATLALPAAGVRVTVDAGYRCVDTQGASVGFDDELIIETKTSEAPSIVDRALWGAGHRPLKISKYATGLAALHPELPANRWAPALRAHFRRPTAEHRTDDGEVQ